MTTRPTARLTGALVARHRERPTRDKGAARSKLLRTKPAPADAATPGRAGDLRIVGGARLAKAPGPAQQAGARVRIGLRLNVERHLQLKLLATHEQRSQQSLLIQALDEYIERHAPDVIDGLRFGPK